MCCEALRPAAALVGYSARRQAVAVEDVGIELLTVACGGLCRGDCGAAGSGFVVRPCGCGAQGATMKRFAG